MQHLRRLIEDRQSAFDFLLNPNESWGFQTLADEMLLDRLHRWASTQSKVNIFVLDGAKMVTESALNTEFSVKFKFPSYFGHNINAILDCLTDEDIVSGDPIIVWISRADEMLVADDQFHRCIREMLQMAHRRWETPVARGDSFDRQAVSFHAIFACNEKLDERLVALPELYIK